MDKSVTDAGSDGEENRWRFELNDQVYFLFYSWTDTNSLFMQVEAKVLHVRASALTPWLWSPPLMVRTRIRYFFPGVRPSNRYRVNLMGCEPLAMMLPLSSRTCRMYPSDTPRASCQLTCRLQVLSTGSTCRPVTANGTAKQKGWCNCRFFI